MKNIIILTSDSLRHNFLRKAIALNENIRVIKSYCERSSKILLNSISDEKQARHLMARDLSKNDFFSKLCEINA